MQERNSSANFLNTGQEVKLPVRYTFLGVRKKRKSTVQLSNERTMKSQDVFEKEK